MSFVDNHELFGEGDSVPHDVQIGRILAHEIVEQAGITHSDVLTHSQITRGHTRGLEVSATNTLPEGEINE